MTNLVDVRCLKVKKRDRHLMLVEWENKKTKRR